MVKKLLHTTVQIHWPWNGYCHFCLLQAGGTLAKSQDLRFLWWKWHVSSLGIWPLRSTEELIVSISCSHGRTAHDLVVPWRVLVLAAAKWVWSPPHSWKWWFTRSKNQFKDCETGLENRMTSKKYDRIWLDESAQVRGNAISELFGWHLAVDMILSSERIFVNANRKFLTGWFSPN